MPESTTLTAPAKKHTPARGKTTGKTTPHASSNGSPSNPRETDWNSLNRLSSAFIASHRDRTLGDVTLLDLMGWAQGYCGMKPKTQAAGR
jgi:hypothetical protein